jgi:hypothetical protein
MTDFRDTLRAELVAAAGRPLPRRSLLPERPVLLRGGLLAAAAAAALLAIFVLPWGAERTPEPAQRTADLPGRPLFGGSLEAGARYRTRALVPPVSLRADGGQWFVPDATSPTTLVLQRREGVAGQGPGEKAPRRFLMLFTLGSVTDPGTGDIIPAPDDLIGWLRSNPNLGVTAVTRTRLYGRPATRVAFHIPQRPRLVQPNCPFGKVTVDTEPPNVADCAAIAPSVTAPAGSAGYLIVPDGAEPLIAGELALVPAEVGTIARESKPILDSVIIGQ